MENLEKSRSLVMEESWKVVKTLKVLEESKLSKQKPKIS